MIPQVHQRYVCYLEAHLDHHQVLPKLCQLHRQWGPGLLSQAQQVAITTLDTVWAKGMIYAEKCSRKLCMGEVDFSPAIVQAGQELDLWRMVW